FSQTPILQALQHVQASCDEAHKMRFSDLFALAEEYEDSQANSPSPAVRTRLLAALPQRSGPAHQQRGGEPLQQRLGGGGLEAQSAEEEEEGLVGGGL
ncbi:unnamed protein product, partial [Tetraodon nigroviridis]